MSLPLPPNLRGVFTPMTAADWDRYVERKEPPRYVVEAAIEAAKMSPCCKTKRGAAIYAPEWADAYMHGSEPAGVTVTAVGFNAPPLTFKCDGSYRCQSACGKICIHAEDRALRTHGALDVAVQLEMVHVKIVDGKLVAGGPPSCVLCSKVVADAGVGMWLFEATSWHDELRCQTCSKITIIPQGGGTTGVCEQCDHVGRLLGPGKRVYGPEGVWRYYTAVEFHLATLRNESLPDSYEHCGKYIGDNFGTSPELHCIRPKHHGDECDNVKP